MGKQVMMAPLGGSADKIELRMVFTGGDWDLVQSWLIFDEMPTLCYMLPTSVPAPGSSQSAGDGQLEEQGRAQS